MRFEKNIITITIKMMGKQFCIDIISKHWFFIKDNEESENIFFPTNGWIFGIELSNSESFTANPSLCCLRKEHLAEALLSPC